MSANVPFDRVVINGGGLHRELSPAEFMALPLPQRIRSIVAREVEFFRNGTRVDRCLALRELSAWQRPALR
jgi:hypothetical protein